MREIKFRAWDESRKQFFTSPKWVEFSVNIKGILTAKNYKVGGMEQSLPIQQFTGLTDKNGVDIYEGDIVNYKIGKRETKTSQITFSDFRFVFNNGKYGIKSLSAGCPKIEVIGNIHQNPELTAVESGND